jgi:tape measure domain-containing protein
MAVSIVGGGPLTFEALITEQQFRAQINRMEASIQGLTNTARKEAEAVDNLVKRTVGAITAYASLATATNFIGDIARVRSEFEALEVSFRTMLRSKEAADRLLAQVIELAAQTPFSLQEVGLAAKQLMAYGFASESITGNIRMLGDVAAGVKAPIGDLVYLYGTLQTQGRAYTRDIMQFTSRGIPIIQALADTLGVAKNEVQGLVEEGKVGFPEVEKAFRQMTGSGGIFFNLMAEQSQTLSVRISNLKDRWSQMLNDIGKSNQGLFTGAIQSATDLITNYKSVIDVIQLLITVYGSYRAAIILTNIATAVSTAAVKGYTIAETLRFQAMLLTDRAMKILNITMLSNPFVAVATGIAAIVAALVIFRKEATQVRTAAQLVAEANKRISTSYEEQKVKVQQYLEVLRTSNLTEQQRINVFNELKTLSPKIVEGLTAQTLSYKTLTDRVNEYIKSIERQIEVESNTEGLRASIKQRSDLLKQITDQKALVDRLKTNETPRIAVAGAYGAMATPTTVVDEEVNKLNRLRQSYLEASFAVQQLAKSNIELTKEQDTNTGVTRRTVAAIQADIDALKKRREESSANREEYKKFTAQIKLLEAELEGITGRQASKAALQEVKEARKELEELLKDVTLAEIDAVKSGLTKQNLEIANINRKYDDLQRRAKELNDDGGIQLRIVRARTAEIINTTDRTEADLYRQSLDEQREMFDRFEEYKKDIGIEEAQASLDEQSRRFSNYIEYLQSELKKVQFDPSLSGQLKRDLISKEIVDAQAAQNKRNVDLQIRETQRIVEATQTAANKRAKIEDKYQKDVLALQKRFGGKDLQDRIKVLQDQKDEELKVITESEIEKSDVYKQFAAGFEDIGLIATRSIREGLIKLKNELKNNAEAVKILDKLIKETDKAIGAKTVAGFRAVANIVSGIAGDFNVKINRGLTITMQQITTAFNNIATLFDKSATTGDQVGSIIGLITMVVVGIRDAAMTAAHLADPLQAQHDAYSKINDEIEVSNMLLSRQKEILNDLVGIQKIQRSFDYLSDLKTKQDDALKSLQDFKVEFINAQREIYLDPIFNTHVRTSGVNAIADLLLWGGQAKRKIQYELEAVDTSNFKTIEEFIKLLADIKSAGGKINGKTVLEDDIKGLELLIKTYNDAVQEQLEFKRQLNQILTGTTEDALVNNIADGFKQGLRSAADFAKSFEDLMRNAILQSLKMTALEGPLREFYEEFAKSSATDEMLTEAEVQQLRDRFNTIIDSAGKKFDDLQKITNINFNAQSGSSVNNLTGAIRGISEQQADLLAGQFGGLRITALDHLNVARMSLVSLQNIDLNIGVLVMQNRGLLQKFDSYETGVRTLKTTIV